MPRMSTGGIAARGGLVLVLAASTLQAAPSRRRFGASGELGVVLFVGSRYRDSLRDFGQNGPNAAFQLAGRARWTFGERTLLGLRLGYAISGAPESNTLPDHPLGASSPGDVSFHLVDLGATLRWTMWRSRDPRPPSGSLHVDLEAGPVALVTTWPRGTDVALLPRFAGSLVLAFGTADNVVLGLRLGGQYIPSGGASGGAWGDPAFAGLTFGLEVGGRR